MAEIQHPLADYPEEERVDYLCLVASIASADEHVSDEEITQLREFCTNVEIGDFGIGLIINAVEDPAVINVQAVIERLSQADLKFTLLTDMFFMAYADGIVSPGEKEEIQKIADALDIRQKQIAAIDR